MTINVFISYDYTSDKEYASLLKAWAENDAEHFKNINFIDGSSDFQENLLK
nr:TIR domain-containing protein [Planococcus glaciei]